MKTLDEIKSLQINGENTDNLIDYLDDYLLAYPTDDEALTMRGLIHWSRSERGLAINDYLEAIRINPDSRARLALKMANSILDYYNKDLYNP
jgi:tetratricopeptide (TPR) repeat protein